MTTKQRNLLEKRAYIFEVYEDLQNAVNELVSNPKAYPPRLNDDYALAYALHKLDFLSTSRVVQTLRSISENDV